MKYTVTKTYPASTGLSCAYRQWRARGTHCAFLHGYALEISIEFGADRLHNGWVIDFGALKPIKDQLVEWFDHITIVQIDDPFVGLLTSLNEAGVIRMRLVRETGCEAFAWQIFQFIRNWLLMGPNADRVDVLSVTVREHGANAATYRAE